MSKQKGPSKTTPTIKNKKAYFNYEIIEKIEAGIVLQGSEVKSLRDGQASLGDTFATIKKSEIWLVKFYIAPYSHSSFTNHEPMQKRKLLLHKREIKKLKSKLAERGYTLIPLKIYFNDGGKAKCLLGLCRGKKKFDKREVVKKRDVERDIQRKYKLG